MWCYLGLLLILSTGFLCTIYLVITVTIYIHLCCDHNDRSWVRCHIQQLSNLAFSHLIDRFRGLMFHNNGDLFAEIFFAERVLRLVKHLLRNSNLILACNFNFNLVLSGLTFRLVKSNRLALLNQG